MKKHFLLFGLILASVSCKNSSNSEKAQIEDIKETPVALDNNLAKGKELMETKCFVCHGPDAQEDARLAPPMVAIKAKYFMGNPTKEEFGDAVWNFVEDPTLIKGKMKGAIKRFGIMPYQPYSEEEIRLISDYIYEFKIEEPEWFKGHWEKGHRKHNYQQQGKDFDTKSESSSKSTKEIGLEMAGTTQKVLGKNLMGKIQKEGPVAALEFCNEKAYPLTDSMSTVHGAKIKRVSDLPRNPQNAANSEEIEYITYFKEKIDKNESYEPILLDKGNSTTFYYPIVTNSMCLKCHGKMNTEIDAKVASMLEKRYPRDKAIGYSINEVRGIWSIVLENE